MSKDYTKWALLGRNRHVVRWEVRVPQNEFKYSLLLTKISRQGLSSDSGTSTEVSISSLSNITGVITTLMDLVFFQLVP